MTLRLLPAALLALAAPLAAAPLMPDMGAFKAEGSFTDSAGHMGQWHAEGTLLGGRFTGGLSMEMLGVTRSFTLVPARTSAKRGACVLYATNEKNRVELRGPCDDTVLGPGTLGGRIDGKGLSGRFEGKLSAGETLEPRPPKR